MTFTVLAGLSHPCGLASNSVILPLPLRDQYGVEQSPYLIGDENAHKPTLSIVLLTKRFAFTLFEPKANDDLGERRS